MAFSVVDLKPTAEMAVAALVFGLGSILAFSAAVAGFTQAQEARDVGHTGRRLLNLAMGTAGAIALVAIVGVGLALVIST